MRLSEVSIQNFRSIKNCTILFNEVTAIVGENNAGKTALLRALNSVFNWEYEFKYFANDSHQYAPRTRTKIKIKFEDVPSRTYYDGKTINDTLSISLNYSYSNTKRKKTLYCHTDHGKITIDDTFIDEIKNDIDYIYIPASRGNRDLMWDDNSIFQRVVASYSKHYSEKRDTISKKVKSVADLIKVSIFDKIEQEIKKISMLEPNKYYSLMYNCPIDYTIFLDKVGLSLYDNNQNFPIIEYGSGIKSLSVIALYRVLAQIEGMNVILGIEEPETNLHPHAQKKLIASIMNKRQNSEVQAIMATHSTVIIDELSHEDIVLARRIPDTKRGFYTSYTQLSYDFWEKYKLDEYKHNKFFRYNNSDFFFAKYVIIVESTTDAQVIDYLINDIIGDMRFYVSIINLDGVKNLKYPYFLLKSLGIPFSMVVDHDMISMYDGKNLKESRDPITYLPKYKKYPNESNVVLNDIWNTDEKKKDLVDATNKSYTQLFNFCKKEKLFIMQYCLEMDLVASDRSRKEFCKVMGIPYDSNSYLALLKDRKDAIKAPDKLLKLLNCLSPSDYPYSYKIIKKALIDDITSYFNGGN